MVELLLGMAMVLVDPPTDARPFVIQVVDDQTGRGVPLVELKTTHNLQFVTDSAGRVAFDEPGLMGQDVFFLISSHGYEYPKDGFGFQGRAFKTEPGGSATLKVRRVNIAERLYRITGAGTYRDTVRAGLKAPIRQPLLNAQVFGSDSALAAIYGGKIHWFWGDTNRPRYPLGNFHVPGATSELPEKGGLAPEVGIDLEYATGPDGFARPTAELPGPGPTWLTGPVVLKDSSGSERMFAHYVKIRPPMETYERGLVEFDAKAFRWSKVATFPLDGPFPHGAHTFLHESQGQLFAYYADAYPLVRIPADPQALARPDRYEAFTPLVAGSRVKEKKIDRRSDGSANFAWKPNTEAVGVGDQANLVRSGDLRREDAVFAIRDVETGKAVQIHRGSLAWNPYRNRWVMVGNEILGTSMLGEVWFAEADSPLGPWGYARKIVTHNKYSYYNPVHRPFFDQDGGRLIYFEGTYTISFSGNTDPTPLYEYNQIMYRLDLSDVRLNLPVAIYEGGPKQGPHAFSLEDKDRRVAFWALPKGGSDLVAVYATRDGTHPTLSLQPPAPNAKPEFHAIAVSAEKPPTATAALYESRRESDGERRYGVEGRAPEGFVRSEKPLVRVWPHPVRPDVPVGD